MGFRRKQNRLRWLTGPNWELISCPRVGVVLVVVVVVVVIVIMDAIMERL